MICKANAAVITAVPFGYANLRNLETAKRALELGIPTFVIDDVPVKQEILPRVKWKSSYQKSKVRCSSKIKANCYPCSPSWRKN